MNIKNLKLLIAFAFLAFAALAFLSAGGGARAQTGKTDDRRDELLELIGNYKKWKEVRKPETKSDPSVSKSEAILIASSTMAG